MRRSIFFLLLQFTFFYNIVALWLSSFYISYVLSGECGAQFFLPLQFTFFYNIVALWLYSLYISYVLSGECGAQFLFFAVTIYVFL